jgi:hypothetical protein
VPPVLAVAPSTMLVEGPRRRGQNTRQMDKPLERENLRQDPGATKRQDEGWVETREGSKESGQGEDLAESYTGRKDYRIEFR